MSSAWDKQDNTMLSAKSQLRRKNLPRDARVLDLFCGEGHMYRGAYKNNVAKYFGVDKEKIHSGDLCVLRDNIRFVLKSDILEYNVFDLDDYGTPWKLLYLIMRKASQPEITVFITDGLLLHQKISGDVTRFVSATERLPKKFNVPGLIRWYEDIFLTMLLDLRARYGYEAVKVEGFHNTRRSVYYWCVKFKRRVKRSKSKKKQRKSGKRLEKQPETC